MGVRISRNSIVGIVVAIARGVQQDGLEQVAAAAIVQEENSLPDAPERRAAELIGTGIALDDVIRKPWPHVVYKQVREQVHGPVYEHRAVARPTDSVRSTGLHGWSMAKRAADLLKNAPATLGAGAGMRIRLRSIHEP